MTGTNGDEVTNPTDLDGIPLLEFLAKVDRFEAALIRFLAAIGDDDASASLSEAQAENADATADGWDQIVGASGEVGDPQGPGPNA